MGSMRTRFAELLDRLSQVGVPTRLTVYTLLVVSASGLARARGRWTAAAAAGFAVTAATWFGVNGRWEGRVLYVITSDHGLTEADLAVPVLLGLALLARAGRSLHSRYGYGYGYGRRQENSSKEIRAGRREPVDGSDPGVRASSPDADHEEQPS